MRSGQPGRSSQRGFALVSVLWGVAILALIATSLLSTATLSRYAARNARNDAAAALILEAGINRAILGLLDRRADQRWRTDGVATEFAFAGTPMTLRIQDELGRIDLNAVSADLLAGLFTSAGLAQAQADGLAAAIVRWRGAAQPLGNGGTDSDDRVVAGWTIGPRRGPFQSVDEVKLVPGMTPELFARVAPALTVYSGSPAVDPQTASPEALRALPDMAENDVRELMAARQANPPEFPSTAARALPLAGHAFAITADLQLPGRRFHHEAIIRLTGDEAHPYLVLMWH